MLPAQRYPPAGQGNVDGFCGQASPSRRPLQFLFTPGNRSLEAVPEFVQPAAGLRTQCRRQGGYLVEELRHKTPTTQVGPARLFQGIEGCGIEDRPLGFARNLVEVFEFRCRHGRQRSPSSRAPKGRGDLLTCAIASGLRPTQCQNSFSPQTKWPPRPSTKAALPWYHPVSGPNR